MLPVLRVQEILYRNQMKGFERVLERQLLKKLKGYGLFKQTIKLQISKGCLPQILLGSFMSTLSRL